MTTKKTITTKPKATRTKKEKVGEEPKNRRGHPDAIAKRRAARKFNALFVEQPKIDKRKEKRRLALIKKLGDKPDAITALKAMTELLVEHGENQKTLRKIGVAAPQMPPMTAEVVATIREAQRLYTFDLRAWRVLGVPDAVFEAQA